MQTIKKNLPGIAVCLAIAIPSWLLGKLVPVIGGPVFSILLGMVIALLWTPGAVCKPGVGFTSKKILQAAVVLLGFGLNLNVVLQTGKQSLPIIVCTITTSLLVAYAMHNCDDLALYRLSGVPELTFGLFYNEQDRDDTLKAFVSLTQKAYAV